MKRSPLSEQPTTAHAKTTALLAPYVSLLALSVCFVGCPSDPEPEPEPDPKLTLSAVMPCAEPILPLFDVASSSEPTIASLEVSLTGVSASESSGLTVDLYYEPARPLACFQSSLQESPDGTLNYRCTSAESAPLTLSARRAYDNLYCTSAGGLELFAEVRLADGRVVRSDSMQVVCLDEARFESACTPIGAPQVDMGLDMGLDMTMVEPLDMNPGPPLPTEWSVSYVPSETSATTLSVQGSTNEAPHTSRYTFKVTNGQDEPVIQTPVRFFLNWSPLSEYEQCEVPCAELTTARACETREACLWTPSSPQAEGGVMGGAEGGVMGGAEGGVTGGVTPVSTAGLCSLSPDWEGGDQRCADDERCEANICLPADSPSLPVAITPLNATTNGTGEVEVSMIAQREPGIFSIRAEVTIGEMTQSANTPTVTILHEIPTQRSVHLSCSPNVVSAYSFRYAPNANLGTNALGYLPYQLSEPSSRCSLQLADRFSGPVSAASVFFLTESGSITQSALSGEQGRASGELYTGTPSPVDVEPFVELPGLSQAQELSRDVGAMTFNPRDGLIRVIAFTQGEASFIDLNADGQDGLYEPAYDLVPLLSEPYIDANDDGTRNLEERYFDANRNGVWDVDVFGRGDFVSELQCAQEVVSYLSQNRDTRALPCLQTSQELSVITNADNQPELSLSRALIRANPATLNAYIWSSALVLGVGLPIDGPTQPALEPFMAECASNLGCSPQTPPLGYPCEGATGADLYLDAVATSPSIELTLNSQDSNLNCLGLIGVSHELIATSPLSPLNAPLNDNELPLTGRLTPSPESCFDERAPLQPYARVYKSFLGVPASASEEPVFTLQPVQIRTTVPDHRVSEGGELTSTYEVMVGICR